MLRLRSAKAARLTKPFDFVPWSKELVFNKVLFAARWFSSPRAERSEASKEGLLQDTGWFPFFHGSFSSLTRRN